MVKQRVRPEVRALADKYFCEQCVRLGFEVPVKHVPKPLKAPNPPRHAFKPRAKPGDDVATLAETGVWIRPRSWGDVQRDYEDSEAGRLQRWADVQARVDRDRAEGLKIEQDHAKWLGYVPPAGIGKTSIAGPGPKMDLDAIWQAFNGAENQ